MKEFLAQDDAPQMLTPKRRSVISTSVELNPSATCQEGACDWPAVIEKAHAVSSARDHAESTGHAVTINHVTREVVLGA